MEQYRCQCSGCGNTFRSSNALDYICPACEPSDATQPPSNTAVDSDVQKNWDEFWRDIVCNPDGTVNVDQVKKELSDFSFIMDQVPKVYCHITGNKMSKLMYRAEDVIRLADDYFNEQLREALKDEKEDAEAASTPQGAVWVKASEYKPRQESEHRPYRRKVAGAEYDYGEIYVTTDEGEIFLDVDNECKYDAQSYERWKDYEILDESGTTPSNQSDAVEFADWVYKNFCVDFNILGAIKQWMPRGAQNTFYSTAQLYEQFDKFKKKL